MYSWSGFFGRRSNSPRPPVNICTPAWNIPAHIPPEYSYRHPDFDPFWAEAEAQGVPLTMHVFTGSTWDGGLPAHWGLPAWSIKGYTLLHTSACNTTIDLICGGVLERFQFNELFAGYGLMEDVEFSHRVSREFRLVLTPHARLTHKRSPASRDQGRTIFRMRVFHHYLIYTGSVHRGAGTLEYLRSGSGDYFFMEINARLQVEHPVTEYLTGLDIVKWQLMIASGAELDFSQQDVQFNGHAVEARVYAEDPQTFIPSPGTITKLSFPEEDPKIRIDHALKVNTAVPPYYDPLLAKVIAWGTERSSASNRLSVALTEFQIEGVKTTIPLNLKILASTQFRDGKIDTNFIDASL